MSDNPPNDRPSDDRPSDRPADAAAEPASPDNRPGQAADPQTPAERLRQAPEARGDDEREVNLWDGSYSTRAMIGKWIFAGAVTIILFLVILALNLDAPYSGYAWWVWAAVSLALWVYFALELAYRKMTVKYHLTSQRFIHQSGLLKRLSNRIEVIDIDDVAFEQGLVQRMMGVGSIKITSSDRSHPELWMRGIDRVNYVATLIDDTRRKERRRRGLHIESI